MKSRRLFLQSKMKMINYANKHFSFFPPLRQICFGLISLQLEDYFVYFCLQEKSTISPPPLKKKKKKKKKTCVWNNFVTKLILPVPRNMTWYVAYFPSTISTAIWSSLKKKRIRKPRKLLNLSNLIHHVNTFQNSRRNSGGMRGHWGIPPVGGSLPLAPLLTEKENVFCHFDLHHAFCPMPPTKNK